MAEETLSEKIARSTFQIIAGNSVGSGFLFGDATTVVTNFHVVASASESGSTVKVRNYINATTNAAITLKSRDLDYAVLKLSEPQLENVPPLEGEILAHFIRGTEVVFAGYPFGLDPLLVAPASISGPLQDAGFVLSGNVNPGNSGGPVVSISTGKVIGIASARRFIGSEKFQEMKKGQDELIRYLKGVSQNVQAVLAGVNFGAFAIVMAQSLEVIQEAMIQNANTGIGIAYSIKHVMNAIENGR